MHQRVALVCGPKMAYGNGKSFVTTECLLMIECREQKV